MREHYNNQDNPDSKRRILAVYVNKLQDEDATDKLASLGTYSSTPDPRYAIDRKDRGHMGRGQYRFFNPSRNYDGEGMDELKKYTEQDYKRMQAYNAGDWYMLGVKAWASVQLGTTVIQKITSGGLWGIESDSGEEYFREVGQAELDDLKYQLLACGFTQEQIDAAFKEVKYT